MPSRYSDFIDTYLPRSSQHPHCVRFYLQSARSPMRAAIGCRERAHLLSNGHLSSEPGGAMRLDSSLWNRVRRRNESSIELLHGRAVT